MDLVKPDACPGSYLEADPHFDDTAEGWFTVRTERITGNVINFDPLEKLFS